MKQFFAALFVFSVLFSSCGKKETGCEPVPVANERAQLIAYCNTNGINYTEHSSGMFYQIMDPGTGSAPAATSIVSVVYTGKHFDNTTFDASSNPITFQLSGLIDGWKIGLPLIKKGGRIKLVLPSALAYSCGGNLPSIKANEPLFFDITLSDVK
jgi:FKBP-type peptidyl-prolyl cis-trans isomerase FkpA